MVKGVIFNKYGINYKWREKNFFMEKKILKLKFQKVKGF